MSESTRRDLTMEKELPQMTLEELRQLFPISPVEPKASWAEDYQEIKNQLHEILTSCISETI